MGNINITKKCRDCGEGFIISAAVAAWLKENNLELFSRCKKCREKNKSAKKTTAQNKKYEDLVSWATDRRNLLFDEQIHSETEREHDAREAHIQALNHVLDVLA